MRILFDIGHPAHVHQFRNSIKILSDRGNDVFVTARDRNIIFKLLEYYNIAYISRGRGAVNLWGKICGLFTIGFYLLSIARKINPDVLVGGSGNVYVSHVAKFLSKKSVIFDDTESNTIATTLYRPFVTAVFSPAAFRNHFGKKHFKYKGYHELSYLGPDFFHPNSDVKKYLGIEPNEKYVIIRFVSWDATHDIFSSGISTQCKRKIVKKLSKYAKVLISAEGSLPNDLRKFEIDIDPFLIHDAMYFSSLIFGESATMASEAAVLGTPAIYINNNRLGYLDEIANKYGFIFSFDESEIEQEKAIEKAEEILLHESSSEYWLKKRNKLLSDTVNVTEFMVEKILCI